MGTRSTTTIHEDGKPLMTFYRQMDGYPSGHGQQIVDFLKTIKLVNGIPVGTKEPMQMANGAGCLAAQMIVHFKTNVENWNHSKGGAVVRKDDHAGGIYIVDHEDAGGQAYHYDVFVKSANGFLPKSGGSIKFAIDGVKYRLDEYDGEQIELEESE